MQIVKLIMKTMVYDMTTGSRVARGIDEFGESVTFPVSRVLK
jgi:hypothetical protein